MTGLIGTDVCKEVNQSPDQIGDKEKPRGTTRSIQNKQDVESGQISIIPKPECFGEFWGDSLTFHHHLR